MSKQKIIYSMRNVSKHYNRKKSSKTFRCPTFTALKLACSVKRLGQEHAAAHYGRRRRRV